MLTNPSPDQADIIRRVQAGDVEAFTVLVQVHQRALRTWVARFCPSGIDPEEIAHRAFIAGFRSIHRFQGDAPLPWFCAIARHELLGELKRQRRNPVQVRGSLADLAELEWKAAETGLASAEGGERRVAALRNCLKQLSQSAADLVQRRYHQGEGLASIAASLGLGYEVVKSRLHALRGKLHDCVTARLAAEGT